MRLSLGRKGGCMSLMLFLLIYSDIPIKITNYSAVPFSHSFVYESNKPGGETVSEKETSHLWSEPYMLHKLTYLVV